MHSIISWDCSYRNFFHLIDGLRTQEYDKNQYELIFVEQRSEAFAYAWNENYGLPTLKDYEKRYGDQFNMRALYLNHDTHVPYHLGKCVNRGIQEASGKYISVMDGDQLLEPDFLLKLTEYFESGIGKIANIHRRSAIYPVGTQSYVDWTRSIFNFHSCLDACPDKYSRLTENVGNFGPMVGAKAELWHEIGGYDESPLWASVLSRAGFDVNTRLEIASKSKSKALLDTFAVHPWHPIGGGGLRSAEKSKEFFNLQQQAIDWSIANDICSVSGRQKVVQELVDSHSDLVNEVVAIQSGEMEDLNGYALDWMRLKTKLSQVKGLSANMIGRLWQ